MRSALALVLLSLSACFAPDAGQQAERIAEAKHLAAASPPDMRAATEVLNRLLSDTASLGTEPGTPSGDARFQASALLAEWHARSASSAAAWISAPRPAIPTLGIDSNGGIGGGAPRTSVVSHVIASAYHARAALALRGRAESVPLQHRNEIARLSSIILVANARLGFRGEADRTLAISPRLLSTGTALTAIQDWKIPPPVAVHLLVAIHRYLRGHDELEAYRFAVLALEGRERGFGTLPWEETTELHHWIQSGASIRFVCPETGTAFLPGQTRSPISGVPHLDYVPAEPARPRAEDR